MRVVLDVVQLALGAVVRDGAHGADPAAEHARLGEELLEPVRFADRRRLVRGAQPAVAVDRPQVHAVTGELRVPLAQHPLAARTRRGRERRALASTSGTGTPAISQNVGARSSCPTGSCTTAGATPADGAGRQTIGSRISESVWNGPLNTSP